MLYGGQGDVIKTEAELRKVSSGKKLTSEK
jgi:hypothetical protein